MTKRSDEILILRRFPGYLRLHVPPLMYDAKASLLLQGELVKIEGVRKVDINKQGGRISVHYDVLVVKEGAILLEVNRIAAGLLKQEQQEAYEKIMKDVEAARVRTIANIAINSVVVAYLVKAHWMLIKHHWLRKPLKNLTPLSAIAVIIYLHRRQITEILKQVTGKKNE
ncbi:MAG: hypothetical protein HY537_06410 [Deltaproteobacteria bacterium]|nr:hypothetical protein [Deltaproteobacteria bacterium]